MKQDQDKLLEAKKIIEGLANGINPITGMKINEDSFINDPQIIRPLFFLSQYLEKNRRLKLPNRNRNNL